MSADTIAPQLDPDALGRELGPSAGGRWARLSIQPALVVVALVGFVIWHTTTTFDSIERRNLVWANIAHRTWQHVELSFVATVIVLAVAIPLGVMLTRRRFRAAAPAVVGIANIGQGAPSVGLLVIIVLLLGIGFWPAILALSLYGLLPALRNTIVGLEQVDPRLVEAGRGMGMSALAVLLRVELPLAVPIIIAGARLALVLLVGTATLVGLVSAGGLGTLITTGITLTRYSVVISGALLVAVLALLLDWLGRVVEEVARPKGV